MLPGHPDHLPGLYERVRNQITDLGPSELPRPRKTVFRGRGPFLPPGASRPKALFRRRRRSFPASSAPFGGARRMRRESKKMRVPSAAPMRRNGRRTRRPVRRQLAASGCRPRPSFEKQPFFAAGDCGARLPGRADTIMISAHGHGADTTSARPPEPVRPSPAGPCPRTQEPGAATARRPETSPARGARSGTFHFFNPFGRRLSRKIAIFAFRGFPPAAPSGKTGRKSGTYASHEKGTYTIKKRTKTC